MRTGSAILTVGLLVFSLAVTAQAPDEDYQRGLLAKPTFASDAKPSLIVGHLATANAIGSFPCPENAICLDSVWDDTFADMQTRLGPAIDPAAHVRSIHDAGLAGRPIVAYVVRPDKDGQLWASVVTVVRHRRACFDRGLADEWPELGSHPGTRLSKTEVCFRLK